MSGHSHGGGGCCHDGDGDGHEDPERGVEYNLYKKINLENVTCLNESEDGAGKTVFKPWDERLDVSKFVESDADEELLFNIPFTGNVKLKGIILIGGEDGSHPKTMKLFKNRPQMPFDAVHSECDQEFELQPDPQGVIEYATKIARFGSVFHLSIYIPRNYGSEQTKVYYIGLRGDFTEARRQEVVICNYELAPNPAEYKTTNDAPTDIDVRASAFGK